MNAYAGVPKGRGRLNSKVAPVMSGGSVTSGWGNGEAAAILFAAEGATVVVVDNRIKAMKEIAIIIEGAGGSTIAVAGDSASEKGVAQAVKMAVSTFGRINILHNNIGGQGSVRSFENITFSDLNEIMTLNVASAMLGCREVMPIMMAQGRGSIINISSIVSIDDFNNPMAAYATGKAAINGFAQNIAPAAWQQAYTHKLNVTSLHRHAFHLSECQGQAEQRCRGFKTAEEYRASREKPISMGCMGTD